MKHTYYIFVFSFFIFLSMSEASANEPREITDLRVEHVTFPTLEVDILSENSKIFPASSPLYLLVPNSGIASLKIKTQATQQTPIENYFVRPHIRKEFRIARLMDNFLQFGLTKVIITI